jgi:hypothetical protein
MVDFVSQLLAEFFLLLFTQEPVGGEDAGRFLAVPGVGDVIADLGGLDALVDVGEVIVVHVRRIELPALAFEVVVMGPHDHVRCCCHRLA